MFYTLVKHRFLNQSERPQGPICILNADKPLGMLVEHSKNS